MALGTPEETAGIEGDWTWKSFRGLGTRLANTR